MNKKTNIFILIGLVILYFVLSPTSIGKIIFGPIEILVAFLHEFGHASMTVLTGGMVSALQVNTDGSGVTTTSGGNDAIITMGGYIGSCVFSNILVKSSLSKHSNIACYILACIILFCATCWFSTLTNMLLLLACAVSFIIIGNIPLISPILLQFIGIACIIHILQDFQVGPSSDLKSFQENVGILSYNGWMYLWLAICILLTLWNIKQIFRN